MSEYRWKKMFGKYGEHRYFKDKNTGRVALADDSGATPDQTDDGVLWLDRNLPIKVCVDSGGVLWCQIPILREDGESEGHTTCRPAEAARVARVYSMQVLVMNESLQELVNHAINPHAWMKRAVRDRYTEADLLPHVEAIMQQKAERDMAEMKQEGVDDIFDWLYRQTNVEWIKETLLEDDDE